MLERHFQSRLIAKLHERYDGCMVLKNDPDYIQGIPDITIFHNDKWAMLECKKDKDASVRPNQEHYIQKADEMSFGRFISPDNENEVLKELDEYFKSKKRTKK